MTNKFGFIYKVVNIINHKVYIGESTLTLDRRKTRHFYDANNELTDMPFHRALRKYGHDNFTWEIIEYCDSKEELDEMEFHYIKQYKSYENAGYNCTLGGDGVSGVIYSEERLQKCKERYHAGGYLRLIKKGSDHHMYGKQHTEETRAKMRKSLGGENHPNYGKELPNATREALLKSKLGKSLTLEHKQKISKTRKERNIPNPMLGTVGFLSPKAKKYIIETPEEEKFCIIGIRKFCRDYTTHKLNTRSLINCAKGLQKEHKGYKCRYFDSLIDNNLEIRYK